MILSLYSFRSCGCENLAVKGRAALGRNFPHCFEASVAMGATQRRQDEFFGFGLGAEAEEMAEAPERFMSGGGEEAVVAHAYEAFGQNVNQPAADKLVRFERDGFPNAGVAWFAAQEDASVAIVALESLFAEGGFADVGGGVAQGGLAPAYVAAVDAPLGFPDRGIDAGVKLGVFFGEACFEAVADALDQRLPGNEEVVVFWVGEAASAGAQCDGRDDQVQVRVMEHLARPGVEDDEEAGVGAEVARVSANLAQGAGAGGKEQAIGKPGMVQEDPAQLLGHGRGEHVVRHRQQADLLILRPLALVEGAAPRAGAVVATVPGEVDFTAIAAAVGRAALPRGAAREDRLDRPAVFEGNAVKAAHVLDVGGPVFIEYLGELHFLPMISSKRRSWTWRPLLSLISVTCR